MNNIQRTIRALTVVPGILLLIATLATNANAELLSYQIAFSGGSPTPTSGSFTYDTTGGLFTSFNVVWNGTNINILPNANTPVTQNLGSGPVFSGQQFYDALVHGGQYNGLDLINTWAVYPPNPPGNVFTSTFLIGLFTANDEGVLTGANYPDPTFIASYTSGTFTVIPLSLTATRNGQLLQLTWDEPLVLQQSSDLSTWQDVIGAISPFTISMNKAPKGFWRLRAP